MEPMRERLITKFKDEMALSIVEHVDADTLDRVAEVIFGESERLEPDNPYSIQIQRNAIADFRGAVEEALRDFFESAIHQE